MIVVRAIFDKLTITSEKEKESEVVVKRDKVYINCKKCQEDNENE